MADWALNKDEFITGQFAADTATSLPSSATTAQTANTKGAWVELIASTTGDTHKILTNFKADTYQIIIDIGIGAASSEVIIVPDLLTSGRESQEAGFYSLPVFIPDGSRVAVRTQSGGSAGDGPVGSFVCIGGGFNSELTPILYDNYGLNLGTTRGVDIDPGGVVHTKGAWFELSSSLTYNMSGGFLRLGNTRNSSRQTYNFLIDVGIGAAASEVVIISNTAMRTTTGETLTPAWVPIPVNIVAGTRVAIRAQCSGIDGSDRKFDAALYGIRQ